MTSIASVVRCQLSVAVQNLRFEQRTTDHGPRTPHSGLTLVELLVVIVILTTIVGAAIPIMSPANDDRRLREASRGLNTFITGAQNRAIASKRPYGVALKRLSQDTGNDDDNGVSLEAFYIEQPAPYAGFDDDSCARVGFYNPANNSLYGGLRPLVLIQFVTRGNDTPINADGLPVGWDADRFPDATIRPRDIIEIGGTQYLLLSDTNDPDVEAQLTDPPGVEYFRSDTGRIGANNATQIVAMPLNNTGQLVHFTHDDRGNRVGSPGATFIPFFTYPAPYKILRQPAPTSDEPYQLPEGTAIDLRASGFGQSDFFFVDELHDNAGGILITFTPEGRVSRLAFNRDPDNTLPFNDPVAENIYLLVGKRENVPVPDPDDDLSLQPVPGTATNEERERIREPINWLNTTSRWVVIGSQSGRIVTVENALVPLPELLLLGSELGRNQQIIAAREFTKQMAQVGGR